jgi:hypothetical protein
MEWTAAARKWQEILGEFDSQGLSRREFCEAPGIKVSTFAYWRTRFRKNEKEKTAVVKIASVEATGAPIRVWVGTRVVVELNGQASEEQLGRVLRAGGQI